MPLFIASMMFVTAEAMALDFKGIKLGEQLWTSEERSVFGTLDCNPMDLGADEYRDYVQEMQPIVPGVRKVCVATTSIATVPADVTVVLGSSRRVLRMTFQFAVESYTQIIQAMTEKWGEGDAEVRDQFDESVWWLFSDGTSISVHRMPINDATNVDRFSLIGLVEYALPAITPVGDL